MKKNLTKLLTLPLFYQFEHTPRMIEVEKDAIVTITTKVKNGMMSDLITFMDSENILPITRNFKGCKSVIQFANKENNIHVSVERWDSAESHQKYIDFRINKDKSGAAEKHLTFV